MLGDDIAFVRRVFFSRPEHVHPLAHFGELRRVDPERDAFRVSAQNVFAVLPHRALPAVEVPASHPREPVQRRARVYEHVLGGDFVSTHQLRDHGLRRVPRGENEQHRFRSIAAFAVAEFVRVPHGDGLDLFQRRVHARCVVRNPRRVDEARAFRRRVLDAPPARGEPRYAREVPGAHERDGHVRVQRRARPSLDPLLRPHLEVVVVGRAHREIKTPGVKREIAKRGDRLDAVLPDFPVLAVAQPPLADAHHEVRQRRPRLHRARHALRVRELVHVAVGEPQPPERLAVAHAPHRVAERRLVTHRPQRVRVRHAPNVFHLGASMCV
mmetsp:Transcript_10913/g.46589  ORF Transcript_10913/g.46589 Transcript_10913/m.46589 type:complete len:326 (-) Transcript_10913:578-1555(-)